MDDNTLVINTIEDIPFICSLLINDFNMDTDTVSSMVVMVLDKLPADFIINVVYSSAEVTRIMHSTIKNPNNPISGFVSNGYYVGKECDISCWKILEDSVLTREQFNLPVNFIFIVKRLVSPIIRY